ncbi:hypothetical protein J2R76_003725 [Bradyrhizobium sp. USDA 4532]|uniref:DUF3540 domain-containing protein n=1 Tax=unclassified Bradyrhizobium TaxID=2631580 RepID=UPI00209D7535|nr:MULTISPECIES: DUF3540 domain-containing protein [unclassified Bradyrhizobium]MCP1835388.1 hypothetical protein [Bradyrhizobium sp. USDA 4545]MCP1920134.1 hypothetical protein [Bradyrhizobium sp. USDA 4532]
MTMPIRATSTDILAMAERLLAPGHHTARVVSVNKDGSAVEVEVAGARHTATVALGCLVRPMPQDVVLLFTNVEQIFIVTVLERTAPNNGMVGLPGGRNMSIEGETITIAARQRLSLRADSIDLQTKLLAVLADKGTWIGKLYTLITDRFRCSARIQEASAEQLTVKAVERVAVIERIDTLQTETQAIRVTGIASEMAHSKVIAVSEDLRLDGKRVTVA